MSEKKKLLEPTGIQIATKSLPVHGVIMSQGMNYELQRRPSINRVLPVLQATEKNCRAAHLPKSSKK